ncbi:unnamed protein product [Didymodactylos carnosus]|uniref:Uncharacterized protein n=1 Tax=Didymodactylos carnosus TaxID=1234261 RepID=A0A814MCG1_9BILA|nr:unnamed protein product [Didymodactylos carnosus]CAF3844070.1 unnamed protein product [Didymodactylos carnosus]
MILLTDHDQLFPDSDIPYFRHYETTTKNQGNTITLLLHADGAPLVRRTKKKLELSAQKLEYTMLTDVESDIDANLTPQKENLIEKLSNKSTVPCKPTTTASTTGRSVIKQKPLSSSSVNNNVSVALTIAATVENNIPSNDSDDSEQDLSDDQGQHDKTKSTRKKKQSSTKDDGLKSVKRLHPMKLEIDDKHEPTEDEVLQQFLSFLKVSESSSSKKMQRQLEQIIISQQKCETLLRVLFSNQKKYKESLPNDGYEMCLS